MNTAIKQIDYNAFFQPTLKSLDGFVGSESMHESQFTAYAVIKMCEARDSGNALGAHSISEKAKEVLTRNENGVEVPVKEMHGVLDKALSSLVKEQKPSIDVMMDAFDGRTKYERANNGFNVRMAMNEDRMGQFKGAAANLIESNYEGLPKNFKEASEIRTGQVKSGENKINRLQSLAKNDQITKANIAIDIANFKASIAGVYQKIISSGKSVSNVLGRISRGQDANNQKVESQIEKVEKTFKKNGLTDDLVEKVKNGEKLTFKYGTRPDMDLGKAKNEDLKINIGNLR